MKRLLITLTLLLPLAAAAAGAQMIELDYRDQDADTAAYRTRVLVTPAFMRLDYGNNRDDFVLLDRRKARVYNVTHQDRQILEISGGKFALTRPEPWVLRHEIQPASPGKRTRKVDLYVNGVLCSQVTAQPGLLPDAVAALKQYRLVLSQVQASVSALQRAEEREYCALAQHVFETSRELDFGLPLAENYQDGRRRELSNYTVRPVEAKLFELPKDYRRVNINDLRGGI